MSFHEIVEILGDENFPIMKFEESVLGTQAAPRTYRILRGEDYVLAGCNEHDNAVVLMAKLVNTDGTESNETYVIKLPKLSVLRTLNCDIKVEDRLTRMRSKAGHEFDHVRHQLSKCRYANPICDYSNRVKVKGYDVPATAQLWIKDAIGLDVWLLEKRYLSDQHHIDELQQQPVFSGMPFAQWSTTALLLAKALRSVHDCRVCHGDFYEKNVLMQSGHATPLPIIIDFAESSMFDAGNPVWRMGIHPYLAPERGGDGKSQKNSPYEVGENFLDEAIDVFSFGIVLLHMATGRVFSDRDLDTTLVDKQVAIKAHAELKTFRTQREGHVRRQLLREFLWNYGREMHTSQPSIADIIARCTSFAAADRPRMREVEDELRAIRSPEHPSSPTVMNLSSELKLLADRLSTMEGIPRAGCRAISKEIQRCRRLLDCYAGQESFELIATRDELVGSISDLLHHMTSGDSWSSISTPATWQYRALGFNGRLLTAATIALRQCASIHRGYVISIPDIDLPLLEQWIAMIDSDILSVQAKLKITDGIEKEQLENEFGRKMAMRGYIVEQKARSAGVGKRRGQKRNKTRRTTNIAESGFVHLVKLIREYETAIAGYRLKDKINVGRFKSISDTQGFYLGLIIRPTAQEVAILRSANPYVVVKSSSDLVWPKRQSGEALGVHDSCPWSLIRAELRARAEIKVSGSSPWHESWPDLLSVKVFRSFRNVPDLRISGLDRALSESLNWAFDNWFLLRTAEQAIASM